MTSPLEIALAGVSIWLRWKLEPNEKGNMTKAPYSAKHPGKGSHTNPADWGTLAQAQAARERWGGDGLGVVAAAVDDEFVQGELDVDGCFSPDSDQRAPWVDPVAVILDGHYCEPSVSGTGLHWHFLVRREVATRRRWRINAKRPSGQDRKDHGFELAVSESGGYYLTVKLNGQGDLRVLEEPQLEALHDAVAAFRLPKPSASRAPARPADPDLHARTLSALAALRNDDRFTERDDWIAIGFAVHDGTGGSLAGRLGWTAWTAEKHADAESSCRRAWDTFTPGGSITVATLFKFARADGWHDPAPRRAPTSGNGSKPPPPREPPPADDEPIDNGPDGLPLIVSYDDFQAYSPKGNFIFAPTGELWPATIINRRLPWKGEGDDKVSPSSWLTRHHPVEQMSWAPGEPQLIRDRLIREGGWFAHPHATVFNLYRPPTIEHGDADKAGPWCALVEKIWPDDAEHIFNWFAHLVQHPNIKINHLLLLGGNPGIGKDTIIEPVTQAIGPWNSQTISPDVIMEGRFNGFYQTVLLRIGEAQAGQRFDRYGFYEKVKLYAATPPDAVRIDAKHIAAYFVPNLHNALITANYRAAFYLPPEDRRHHVAWSRLSKEDFEAEFWVALWAWYRAGGFRHVAAWLARRDLSSFNPKAPPPRTEAFHDIVSRSRAGEASELADAIDKLGVVKLNALGGVMLDRNGQPEIERPAIVTLADVLAQASSDFAEWLRDRKNQRAIPHRFEDNGYEPVRNPDSQQGLWVIGGARQVVYGRRELDLRELIRLIGQRQKTSR